MAEEKIDFFAGVIPVITDALTADNYDKMEDIVEEELGERVPLQFMIFSEACRTNNIAALEAIKDKVVPFAVNLTESFYVSSESAQMPSNEEIFKDIMRIHFKIGALEAAKKSHASVFKLLREEYGLTKRVIEIMIPPADMESCGSAECKEEYNKF